MRELKFRVYKKDTLVDTEYKLVTRPLVINLVELYKNLNDIFLNKLCVFQQYTGTKDKNGTDIYEGDIVDVLYWNEDAFDNKIRLAMNGVVEYNEKYSTYYVVCKCEGGSIGHCSLYSKPDAPRLKIIGNICENPNLLK